jgi:hypothetical protein
VVMFGELKQVLDSTCQRKFTTCALNCQEEVNMDTLRAAKRYLTANGYMVILGQVAKRSGKGLHQSVIVISRDNDSQDGWLQTAMATGFRITDLH